MNALRALSLAGLAAGVAIVVLLVWGVLFGLHKTSTGKPVSSSPPLLAPPTPPGTPGAAVPPNERPKNPNVVDAPGAAAGASCRQRGSQCTRALLYLINRDRVRRALPVLALDMTQTHGKRTHKSARRCVGAVGHSRAMASTGGVWHVDARHPRAGYPLDICDRSVRSAENVAVAPGPVWSALTAIESRMSAVQGKPTADFRHLFSARFTRIGLGIVVRAGRVYVTEDFLAR